MPWDALPDGTFVMLDHGPAVVVGDHLTLWTYEGYGARELLPRDGVATVITPPATVAVLRAGYAVQIDDSARGAISSKSSNERSFDLYVVQGVTPQVE